MSRETHSAADHDVSVWRIRLDPGDQAAELEGHLAQDELERLERLRRSEVGRRWLVGRAALREILAAELGISPASVRLEVGPHGRPGLDPSDHGTALDFNLSHSGDLALLATARGPRVGIDVELLRPGRNPLRVADRYFSQSEAAVVRALPEPDRPAAFLRYWTAKEALAKGLGSGLTIPWDELELVQEPGGTLVPVKSAESWRLLEVGDLPPGYCGTLAVDDPRARIVLRDWRPGPRGG